MFVSSRQPNLYFWPESTGFWQGLQIKLYSHPYLAGSNDEKYGNNPVVQFIEGHSWSEKSERI